VKTIVYGSQTSLGQFYCDHHQELFCIEGTPLVVEMATVLRSVRGRPIQLVCLDGINHLSVIGETPVEDASILNRNVFLPYMLVNEMVAMGLGPMRCVFVVSQTHRIPQRTTSLYCASKAALAHLIKVMARELASKGWIINGLAPGKIVDTKMAELTDQQVLELRGWNKTAADAYATSNVPMKRFTNREEVCAAIDWLMAAPDYVNGTVVDMTGGA